MTLGSDRFDTASGLIQVATKKMDPAGKIGKLRPAVQPRMRAMLWLLAYQGYGRVGVLCTVRTVLEQKHIYGKGRTEGQLEAAGISGEYAEPGASIVTWTTPEQSKHVHGMAMDLVVTHYDRKEVDGWADLAKCLGLIWGGTWEVNDWGHFETMGGY